MWKKAKPSQQSTPTIIKIETIIGYVPQPTEEDYNRLKSDGLAHESLHKILDYRIANAYRDLSNPSLSDGEMRSAQGAVQSLQGLKLLLK